MKEILESEGKIDILINNAGLSQFGPLVDVPIEDVQRLIDTNVIGPLRMVQAVAPSMIRRRKGHIINIGSVVGILSTPYAGMYCASKAALHAWSHTLRMELAPFGIKVSVIAPGGVQSSIAKKALKSEWEESEHYSQVAEYIALRENSSQHNPMPTDKFARQVLKNVVMSASPPRWYCLGRLSGWISFAGKWLPYWLTDWILSSKFGLRKLAQLVWKMKKEQDRDKKKN